MAANQLVGNQTVNIDSVGGGFSVVDSQPTLKFNIITRNISPFGAGIGYEWGAGGTVEGCLVADNEGHGIGSMGGASPTVNWNTIANNRGYGVMNLDDSLRIDARYNNWGDPSGPGGVGPGTGDEVSDYVDYVPWLGWPLQFGWPQETGGWIMASPVVANVNPDDDATYEVIIGTGHPEGDVYVWRYDGTLMPGWPQSAGETIIGTPAAADIDAGGGVEIVPGAERQLWAWHYNGTPVAGWPVDTANGIFPGPTLADIDRDHDMEIGIGAFAFTAPWVRFYLYHHDGSLASGWPQSIGFEVWSTAAVGDLDRDGDLEYVVGCDDGNVYAWHHDGTPLLGWPQTTGGYVESSPALADLDGDDDLEIAVGSLDGNLYVWHHDGSCLDGWPQSAGGGVESSPALGDLDGDGDLEIVVGVLAMLGGLVQAWHHDGTPVAGWPVLVPDWVESSPAIGDIDGDTDQEVVVGCMDNWLYAWHHNGTPVLGFPLPTLSPISTSSPALADLDGDGDIEIAIASTDDHRVYVWDLPGTYSPADVEWGQFHHDRLNTGRYRGLTPVCEISYEPPNPVAGYPVAFHCEASDPDGGALISCTWDFGDGMGMVLGFDVEHIYTAPGIYEVRAVVVDDEWTSGVCTVTINVGQPVCQVICNGSVCGGVGPTMYYYEITSPPGLLFDHWHVSTHDDDLANYHNWALPPGWAVIEISGPGFEGDDFNPHGGFSLPGGICPYHITLAGPPIEHGAIGFDHASEPHDVGWQLECVGGACPAPFQCTTDWGSPVGMGQGPVHAPVRPANLPPQCCFTYEPPDPNDQTPVQFTDCSVDPDGNIVTWEWDFDDGWTSNEQNPTHLFPAGTWEVCLTVTDDGLPPLLDTCCQTITVSHVNLLPTCHITWEPPGPYAGDPVQLHANAADPEGGPVTCFWSFGDGGSAAGCDPIHIYTEPGVYLVCVTVTDEEGLATQCCERIAIGPGEQLCFTREANCWHMITVPCYPVNPDPWEVFDELRPPSKFTNLLSGNLHRYDHDQQTYVTYRRFAPSAFGPVRPGDGYWLWLFSTESGTETICYEAICSREMETVYFRDSGWYLMGSPQPNDTYIDDTLWTCGDSVPMPFHEIMNLWVQDPLIYYDCDAGGYRRCGLLPLDDDDHLRAFSGYWLYVFRDDVTLLVPPGPFVPTLWYHVGECTGAHAPREGDLPPGMEIWVSGRYVMFHHDIVFNCCPDFLRIEFGLQGHTISIYEVGQAIEHPCYCICTFPTDARIGPFEDGHYLVEVYDPDGRVIAITEVTIPG